jgi:choline-sulfatase
MLLPGGASCGKPSENTDGSSVPPDLILVVIDTWRWDALGANGSPRADITPHLDTLAARGVRFSRAFASSPWTAPSIGTIVTGRHPTVHGSYGRSGDVGPIRAGIPTLAELLAAAGYRTLAVANGLFLSPSFGFDRGFAVYDYVASSNRAIRHAGDSVDAALKQLRKAHNGGPLFLFLHLFDPHLAYDPPPPWDRRWTEDYQGPFKGLRKMRSGAFDPSPKELAGIRALYDGEVAYADQELGRFFRELETILSGRERMIVVTADHGEEMGEHGAWEHGHAMYRELLQVPLLIVPPASRRVARPVVDAQVRLLDLMPTFLEAASIEPPAALPGVSLFPWFEQSAPGDDLVVYSEREHLGAATASVRDGNHALIYYAQGPRVELFDQRRDPAESTDLAEREPERVRVLREQLAAVSASLEQSAAALEGGRESVNLTPDQLEQMRSLGYLED